MIRRSRDEARPRSGWEALSDYPAQTSSRRQEATMAGLEAQELMVLLI